MRTSILVAALLLAAAPAAAQRTIQPGQSLAGQLSASDRWMVGDRRYDVWHFNAAAGHVYRVTLRSGDFDAFVTVGGMTWPGCEACATDDNGAGGTDAQAEYTSGPDGILEIRASSSVAGTGQYELTLEDRGPAEHEHAEEPSGIAIAPGPPVSGTLERGDKKDGAGYTDTYTYQGHAGEVITITLRAENFAGWVSVGSFEGGECTQMDAAYAHDNAGTRIVVTLEEDGPYHIHVGAERQTGPGRYTLLLERAEAPAAASSH